jgi:Ni/Co efflux regulator RcnB
MKGKIAALSLLLAAAGGQAALAQDHDRGGRGDRGGRSDHQQGPGPRPAVAAPPAQTPPGAGRRDGGRPGGWNGGDRPQRGGEGYRPDRGGHDGGVRPQGRDGRQGGDQNRQGWNQNSQGGDPDRQGWDRSRQGGDQNRQGWDRNRQGGDPNRQGWDRNRQGGDPNRQGWGQNRQGWNQNHQGWDWNRGGDRNYRDRNYGGDRGVYRDGRDHHGAQRWDRHRYPPVYRSAHRYRGSAYYPPVGFYAYSWGYGDILPRGWYGDQYRLLDWWNYGLPEPPPGYDWVRVGDDVLLIEEYSGRVVQVVRDLFW